MKTMIPYLTALILIPLLDYVWLALLMKHFYLAEMGPISRVENGSFKPVLWAGVIVYIVLALGITLFVLPRAESVLQSLALGAALGFTIYAVYDFTNLSILQNWSVQLTITDLCWGTALCGMVSAIAYLVQQKFTS